MTAQEYYDLLVCSALDGTFPSTDGNRCCYRCPDGRACAIGILVPDETSSSLHEGCGIGGSDNWRTRENQEIAMTYAPEGLTFRDLVMAQNLHDHWANRKTFMNFVGNFIKELNDLPWVMSLVKHQVAGTLAPSEKVSAV